MVLSINTERVAWGRVVIVGLGGIGSHLCRLVTMFNSSLKDTNVDMLLIDGDNFEERNRERMEVISLGNKAELVAGEMTRVFGRPGLFIDHAPVYLDEENVGDLLQEGDIILSCVDNHATRKIISDHCTTLRDVALISGGNDGVDDEANGAYGNVQVYVRRDDIPESAALTDFHPEIQEPDDEVPGPSCVDLAETTAPQIVFTNFFAAAVMGNAYYRLLRADEGAGEAWTYYDEACFDILQARLEPLAMSKPLADAKEKAYSEGADLVQQ